MGISEKIGIAISIVGVLPGIVEIFFPGEIAGMTRQSRKMVLGACAALVLVGLSVAFLWPGTPRAASGPVDIKGNNTGVACASGAKCVQNNYSTTLADADRSLDIAAKKQILALLPKGSKRIDVHNATGDSETARYAQQIVDFLDSEGFEAQFDNGLYVTSERIVGVHISPTIDQFGIENIAVGAKK
ncbi:MAG: hypothetical protein JSR60_11785 [Proteobacteria bacterium]|nr:hypothetical protein [Pseudomonadota bacterium]